jgi:hypothetical protein
MGTPHQGGQGVNLGKVLANVASVVMKTNKKMLEILERDSEALQEQQRQFSTIRSKLLYIIIHGYYSCYFIVRVRT